MFGINTYFLIVIGVVFSMMTAYFFYAQHEMKNMEQTIEAQKIQILSETTVIAQMKKDALDIKTANQKLSQIVQADQAQQNILETKLESLNGTPTKNAQQLQIAINQASANRTRCLALATGAAPLKNEVNKLCPQLLPQKKTVKAVKKPVTKKVAK